MIPHGIFTAGSSILLDSVLYHLTLYRIGKSGSRGEIRLGSELIAGLTLEAGDWIVQPLTETLTLGAGR